MRTVYVYMMNAYDIMSNIVARTHSLVNIHIQLIEFLGRCQIVFWIKWSHGYVNGDNNQFVLTEDEDAAVYRTRIMPDGWLYQ